MLSRYLLLLLVLLPTSVGCGRVVFQPRQQQPQGVTLTPDQQQLFAQQQQEMQRRAQQLDADNQELEALLAQSKQQTQLLRDQVVATQDQLKATTERLASTQKDNVALKTKTDALVASVKQPFSAGSIRPNSTMLQPLALRDAPGVDVRQDGDVIRVAISADSLFYTGSEQLQPTGQRLVESVASELVRTYNNHRIGIEGHTDGAPINSAKHPTSHHLSVAQATTVYDILIRGGLPAAQLFVVGHGANHPVVSNATEAGRQKNRRLELVVYPETIRRR